MTGAWNRSAALALLGFLAAVFLAAAVYENYKRRKMYKKIDAMLDAILHNDKAYVPDLQEGWISLLAHKVGKLQDKMSIEISRAEREKEQIKQLISNMSHQLKTPLSNVMLYEDILLDKAGLTTQEQKKFLSQMKIHTEKIEWILNSLFKMVQLEQDTIDFVVGSHSIKKTIASAMSTVYEKALKKDIVFRMQDFSDVSLRHNPEWTAEVFVNLFENALKYSPDGSSVEILFQSYEMYAVIQVKDQGIGIPKWEQQDIFKRFYRGENAGAYQGSGIGLYLSKLIIEKENGYITVDAKPGGGSCFSVFLQKSSI